MSRNQAAVIPAPKAPFEIRDVETYTPGPHEVLIRNEAIAFNPIDYKVARLALLPVEYPFVPGSGVGGTVEAVGPHVTSFKVGDKVFAAKKLSLVGNRYQGFQKYVLAADDTVGKVPENSTVEIMTSFTGNLETVVGLFTGRLGLERASLTGSPKQNGKKILIYGGSSSLGSAAVQYVVQAGYTVITTTSPAHQTHVSKLGATKIIDHTQPKDDLIKALISEGPYDIAFDAISNQASIAVTGPVVDAQGGGNLYATVPAFGKETLPESVTRVFEPWPAPLDEEKNVGLREWAYHTYLPQSVANGSLIPSKIEKIDGGLKAVETAIERLANGVSGVKLIIDPRE